MPGNREITPLQCRCPTIHRLDLNLKGKKTALQWKNHVEITFTLTSPVTEHNHSPPCVSRGHWEGRSTARAGAPQTLTESAGGKQTRNEGHFEKLLL